MAWRGDPLDEWGIEIASPERFRAYAVAQLHECRQGQNGALAKAHTASGSAKVVSCV